MDRLNKARPFIKWVGGKGQLIDQLIPQLPTNFDKWENVTYIEPFVGGGAMLFHMLQHYPNITHAVISDINSDLITCYLTVRDSPEELICSLKDIENHYLDIKTEEERKAFFLDIRAQYNRKNLSPIENTSKFFFLNKTCFNGLYRVNKSGTFNVPFGKYKNPMICDSETIRKDSEVLQKVDILNGDFEETINYAIGKTLFYFDPPYRPLSDTSNFNDYTKEPFNDDAQVRLKRFCDKVDKAGYSFMLSNSDGKGKEEADNFFDILYKDYHIERVWAARSVNANPKKRGKLTEILVHNYPTTKVYPFISDGNSQSSLIAEDRAKYGKNFEEFMSQLRETNQTLDFFCDFEKIEGNVNDIKLSLCMLNSLIGATDLRKSVEAIWNSDKTAFRVMDIQR